MFPTRVEMRRGAQRPTPKKAIRLPVGEAAFKVQSRRVCAVARAGRPGSDPVAQPGLVVVPMSQGVIDSPPVLKRGQGHV